MKKNTKIMLLIVCILAFVLIMTQAVSYAKYASSVVWNYYLESKGFYFNSDDLGKTTVKNINNNWDGESVHFNVKNSLNASVITDFDIKYRVECTVQAEASNYSECKVNGTEFSTFEGTLSSFEGCVNNTNDEVDVKSFNKETCEISGYEWRKQEAIKDLYFDVIETTEEEITNVTVEIKVTSLSPYNKTLTGEFTVIKGKSELGSINLEYKSFDDYERVNVTNSYNENKCLKLLWNSNDLRIDIYEEDIKSYKNDTNGYINEIVFNVLSKNNTSYIFYKIDKNQVIDKSSFSLTETDEC